MRTGDRNPEHRTPRLRTWLTPAVFLVVAGTLTLAVGAGVTAAGSPNWWRDNLGGPSSSHFSPLDQINKTNVNQLKLGLFYPYAPAGFNPIVVDDVMYVSGRNSSLIAVDATTGK